MRRQTKEDILSSLKEYAGKKGVELLETGFEFPTHVLKYKGTTLLFEPTGCYEHYKPIHADILAHSTYFHIVHTKKYGKQLINDFFKGHIEEYHDLEEFTRLLASIKVPKACDDEHYILDHLNSEYEACQPHQLTSYGVKFMGFPHLAILANGYLVFLDFPLDTRNKSSVTSHQLDHLSMMKQVGLDAYLCYSCEHFAFIINKIESWDKGPYSSLSEALRDTSKTINHITNTYFRNEKFCIATSFQKLAFLLAKLYKGYKPMRMLDLGLGSKLKRKEVIMNGRLKYITYVTNNSFLH